jgi:uncharacterized protein
MLRIAKALALIVTASVILLLGAGEFLSSPAVREVGHPPVDLDAASVRIPVSGEEYLVGWFCRGKAGGGAILLLHSVRSDRREMLDRARFLKAKGYSVLLVDLAAHGESSGARITFGARESQGVHAAANYLRAQLPGEKMGAIGVSLGAASLVLAQTKDTFSALVLESMYPTIREAVENRLAIRFGALGKYLAPLLIWQIPLRTGITEAQLRPIDAIAKLNLPVLIITGSEDRHTTLAEAQRIFEAANEPKSHWVIQGAAHVNLHRFNPAVYEAKVLWYLAKYLER